MARIHNVEFSKALRVLERLLTGSTPKEVAYDLGLSKTTITNVKKMFPLFLGQVHEHKEV